MDHPRDIRTMFVSWLQGPVHHNETLKKWFPNPRFRSARSMTRDPYIMFYCAAEILNRFELQTEVKVPFYLMRPNLYHWIKWLRTRKEKHKRKYIRHTQRAMTFYRAFGLPMYAVHLTAWMAWIIQAKEIQEDLRIFTPHWNYLIRQLIQHPTTYLDRRFIENYLSKEGYRWTDKEQIPHRYLMEGEPIYLDRDILQFIYKLQK